MVNKQKMISPLSEKLTSQFYEWEILGRGWLLGNQPIELEPPFTPFFGHFVEDPLYVDDGLHHTVFSKIASLFTKKQEVKSLDESVSSVQYDPYLFDDDNELITLRLIIPKEADANSNNEQLLTMLSYCMVPIAFELIGSFHEIKVQFRCRENLVSYIKAQVKSFFPKIEIIQTKSDLDEILSEEYATTTVDYGLKEEFMRPLVQNGQSRNPFIGFYSILEHLKENERVVMQVLFNGVINKWEQSIVQSVMGSDSKSFFVDAPEMLNMAMQKVSNPLMSVSIRLLSQANSLDMAQELLSQLSFALVTSSRSVGNSITPLSDQQYTFDQRIEDILFCESHRLGMLLNTKELSLFVNIPTCFPSKKLFGIGRKTKAAPNSSKENGLVLGFNDHNAVRNEVAISNQQRLRHTHIIGSTGTGKSTLLEKMIMQDMQMGNGIAVLDPHGDLIENILLKVPQARIQDIILFDPSDTEYPISFNILQAHSELEKEILSSDLVATFRRLSTSWGDQMNSVLANAILALLTGPRATLLDLRRFLIEKEFRSGYLKQVKDPNVIYYWQKEYPLLKTTSIGPILTRLDSFLRPRIIRNMVAQNKGLDFAKIINDKKILLVKLPQGLIGIENSFMLGTFVVSKIHQAAFARQGQEYRNDFFLYVDEFQHFITPSMSAILSGARKYHVGLILAHQEIQQLQKYDSELAGSIIANAGTRICFRVGDTDAKRLADGFSFFDAKDLQNLGTGEAIVRIDKADNDFSLQTLSTEIEHTSNFKDEIISSSREKYCLPRQSVEEEMVSKYYHVVQTEQEAIERNHEPISSEVEPKARGSINPIPHPLEEVKPDEALKPPQRSNNDYEQIVAQKKQTQHRYLQNLIKKIAESRGYKATIEAIIPDGRVDVLLEKAGKTIACEVSVTTDPNWEIHNIKKCLAARCQLVICCIIESKCITALKIKLPEHFSQAELHRIKVMHPDTLIAYLNETMAEPLETEKLVKGYRVKVSYDSLSDKEMKDKKDAVAKVVIDALRKLKQ